MINKVYSPTLNRSTGEGDLIRRELIIFVEPQLDLLFIDRRKDFGPGGHRMFLRGEWRLRFQVGSTGSYARISARELPMARVMPAGMSLRPYPDEDV